MNDVSGNKVIGLCLLVLVVGFFLGHALWTKTVFSDGEDLETKIENAVRDAITIKDLKIENLEKLIEGYTNVTEETDETEEIELKGYLVDELYLETGFNDTYSDRELNLFDGEIDFDGKDYDAEETLILKDIRLLANENDFEGNVYMTVPEGAIEYKFEFEDDLNTSEITDEETLEFNFLGKEVEISAWDNDEITIFMGTEMLVDEGEIVEFESYKIVLISVTDNSVYLSVEDSSGELETKIIDEDKTRTVNGLKIRVDDVFSSGTKSFAELVVGNDLHLEVTDGEEYEEDSIWNWKISANSIGIVLNEDFTEVDSDGDEDFPAVGVGEKLCLPNDYVCVQFNGMDEVDSEEYTFELDTKKTLEYVRVEGSFQSGIENYDRIYINISNQKFYDKDFDEITDIITLGDSDLELELFSDERDWIQINKLYLLQSLDLVSYDGTNISSKDENFLTNYGILIVNPEDSCEDQEFNIFIPENKIEGSISLI